MATSVRPVPAWVVDVALRKWNEEAEYLRTTRPSATPQPTEGARAVDKLAFKLQVKPMGSPEARLAAELLKHAIREVLGEAGVDEGEY